LKEFLYSYFSLSDVMIGSIFYFTTGLHGFHVLFGSFGFFLTLWLILYYSLVNSISSSSFNFPSSNPNLGKRISIIPCYYRINGVSFLSSFSILINALYTGTLAVYSKCFLHFITCVLDSFLCWSEFNSCFNRISKCFSLVWSIHLFFLIFRWTVLISFLIYSSTFVYAFNIDKNFNLTGTILFILFYLWLFLNYEFKGGINWFWFTFTFKLIKYWMILFFYGFFINYLFLSSLWFECLFYFPLLVKELSMSFFLVSFYWHFVDWIW
jgi:hypothetical protein